MLLMLTLVSLLAMLLMLHAAAAVISIQAINWILAMQYQVPQLTFGCYSWKSGLASALSCVLSCTVPCPMRFAGTQLKLMPYASVVISTTRHA